jgi:hypothetical protein
LGADASFSGSATPGTPLTINWSDATPSRADERDMFLHVNRVHDFIKAIDPTLTQVDYAMNTMVGRVDNICPGNAWWDGSGINLCEANATYSNTGRIGNVVYHEYGHGVTQFTYSRHGAGAPPSDLHEGNSDVLANLIDRQPIIASATRRTRCTTPPTSPARATTTGRSSPASCGTCGSRCWVPSRRPRRTLSRGTSGTSRATWVARRTSRIRCSGRSWWTTMTRT